MHLSIVYGTRPEYLKLVSLINTFRSEGIPLTVIRVCQHQDILETDLIYDLLLPINESTNRLHSLGAQILTHLPELIPKTATHLLIQGDTSTVFYSALCAFQMNLKVVHLEAGMRTYDLENPFPEEGYRQMVSRITDIHLVPHEHNKVLLEKEGVNGSIETVGNTILDLVQEYNLQISQSNTVYITFHRRENSEHLNDFVNALKETVTQFPHFRFIWILHPNKALQKRVIETVSHHELPIEFDEPMDHQSFCQKLSSSFCLLTDSGGIQEECAFLGKPCIVLRRCTERDQIPFPYLQLVSDPFETLTEAMKNVPTEPLPPSYVYGDGNACQKILHILRKGI
jgi:UDP-N-acetylglucosamine 2-epimerase (non-hydrolysing)